MAPVETALSLADRESPPISPSLPAGGQPSVPPPAEPVAPPAPAALGGIDVTGERPSARPKAQRRVSKRFAALLVGLGLIAGFGIAVIVRALEHTEGSTPAAEAQLSEPIATLAANTPSPAAPARPVSSAVPPSQPSAPAAPPAETATAPRIDETGQHAPSCDTLLASVPEPENFPGAAFEQLKSARKALVQGKVDDAQRAYCQAVRWDADNPLHYFELAHLLLIRRDGAAATEWAEKGLRLDPSSVRGQSLAGDGRARVGDVEGARRAWFAAGGVNTPSSEEIEQLIQRSLKEAEEALASRDHVRAERFFRRAAVLDGKNPEGPRGLSMALTKLGDASNAVAWARRAIERGKADPMNHLALGDALLAAGDKNGAREAWLEAERLGYAEARRRISRLDRAR
jgi:tetratricopeptide (TPR) repeat protein